MRNQIFVTSNIWVTAEPDHLVRQKYPCDSDEHMCEYERVCLCVCACVSGSKFPICL